MKYSLIICGGTFDRLHAGHKAFLRFAFEKGDRVLIGLTSDAYVALYKGASDILPFVKRKEELEAFLQKEGFLERAILVSIDSRFDQTKIEESANAALLVSEETEKIGKEINKEREKNNLLPLALLVFPLIRNRLKEKISSSEVRDGKMTREGVLLPEKSFLSKSLHVTEDVREILHQPFGMLFARDIPKQFLKDETRIISVGDKITKRLHTLGVNPAISVIDFLTERKKTNESLPQMGFIGNEKIVHIHNPSGQLSATLWKKLLSLRKGKQKNTVIIVDGEEDLLVIPLILLLPLGDIVMYGQPAIEKKLEEGVVILEITEKLKEQTYAILRQFVHK